MFLSVDEICELTGFKTQSAQRRWLNNHGYPFDTSRSGKPKVLRSYLEQRLCPVAHHFKGFEEPNFDAIK